MSDMVKAYRGEKFIGFFKREDVKPENGLSLSPVGQSQEKKERVEPAKVDPANEVLEEEAPKRRGRPKKNED